ncbi:hypothetical protein ACLVWU_08685 [Bdellovibrio sp. HCB290]|uniref:hypothetical protein n=1 Tax=Bdellovibrio sp. HCB290 TaxID=3394356 RepID=UPI0039B4C9BF
MDKFLFDIYPTLADKIVEQIERATQKASQQFDGMKGDEDTVTGSLFSQLHDVEGQMPMGVDRFVWRTEYNKLKGRGKGAPENKYGADGIIVVRLFSETDNKLILSKGLLFQAKIKGNSDQNLKTQMEKLASLNTNSVLVEYDKNNFRAVLEKNVLNANGKMKQISPGDYIDLGTVFGDMLLRCQVGKKHLDFDAEQGVLMDSDPEMMLIAPARVENILEINIVHREKYVGRHFIEADESVLNKFSREESTGINRQIRGRLAVRHVGRNRNGVGGNEGEGSFGV